MSDRGQREISLLIAVVVVVAALAGATGTSPFAAVGALTLAGFVATLIIVAREVRRRRDPTDPNE
jgi:hypothetical protein